MYNEPPALYDKNTVELMIEEQQEEIRRLEEEAQKRVEELRLNKEELRAKDDELEALRRELAKWTENVSVQFILGLIQIEKSRVE